MPTVPCAHCAAAVDIVPGQLEPRDIEVECSRCGSTTTVDGLSLLQEGASELELDWGDRSPPARDTAPARAPASVTVPVVRAAPEPSCSEPASGSRGLVLDFAPSSLASVVAAGSLTVGALVESFLAVCAMIDALLLEEISTGYLQEPRRFTIFLVAAASFGLWRWLVHGQPSSRRCEPLLEAGGGAGAAALAVASLLGWLVWGTYVLRAAPHISRPGFLLESGLGLCGAAAFLKALFLAWQLREEDGRRYALEGQRRLDARWQDELAQRTVSASSALPPVPAPERVFVPAAQGELALPEDGCPACGARGTHDRCEACGAVRRLRGARVLRVLSQKPHARTYLAEGPGGRFVLKEMAFALVPDVEALAAFEREAVLLRGLQHSKIPRFLGSLREGEGAQTRFYLAQEHVDGCSLEEELRSHRYSEPEVVELLGQVLRVLSYLHGLSPPVLHRDVKPANLIRRRDGAVVLVDFGAAREGGVTLSSATLVGTFGYMPPEQLAGQVDETSDLYALGMTALHLLTRRPPWELFAEEPDAFPRRIRVSPPLRRFLQKLVARKRADRFPSARRALAELGKVGQADEAVAEGGVLPAVRQGRGPAAAATAIALAVAALSGWLLAESRKWAAADVGISEQSQRRGATGAPRHGMREELFDRAMGEDGATSTRRPEGPIR